MYDDYEFKPITQKFLSEWNELNKIVKTLQSENLRPTLDEIRKVIDSATKNMNPIDIAMLQRTFDLLMVNVNSVIANTQQLKEQFINAIENTD